MLNDFFNDSTVCPKQETDLIGLSDDDVSLNQSEIIFETYLKFLDTPDKQEKVPAFENAKHQARLADLVIQILLQRWKTAVFL